MHKKHRIGRNDPCPCGSGKKYKKCCGASSQYSPQAGKIIDLVSFNREIAYAGIIGGQRRDFCVSYMANKQQMFKQAQSTQMEFAKKNYETISCHKGCSYCCNQYISATLGECEAIVYYLYEHERLLAAFLEAYPKWWAQLERSKDLLERIFDLSQQAWDAGFKKEDINAIVAETEAYTDLCVSCPFLYDDICSIYEVRPKVCASIFVTTPAEWCNPMNPNRHKVKTHVDTFEGFDERPLYYKNVRVPMFMLCMPLIVQGILQNGVLYLSKFHGLENLAIDFMNAPQVKEIRRKYGV